ncbi:MAG: hypothetical protein R2795_14970 [Saprospiraceae bacterium]
MKKFLSNDGELFIKIRPFVKEYGFQYKYKGTYGFALENEYCLVSFGTERYEDSLITILTDKKTEKRYTYVDLYLAKGSPTLFLVEGKSENNGLISKVLETIEFLKAHADSELKGDFSTMN